MISAMKDQSQVIGWVYIHFLVPPSVVVTKYHAEVRHRGKISTNEKSN